MGETTNVSKKLRLWIMQLLVWQETVATFEYSYVG